MPIKKVLIATIILIISGHTTQVSAQAKEKVVPKALKNESTTTATDSAKNANVFLFPDFYQYGERRKGDTTWYYELYDKDMRKLNMFGLKSVDEIDHIKYLKSFPKATSGEMSGPVSTPYICELQYKLVHPSPEIWLTANQNINTITRYKLSMNKIVRSENVTLTDGRTKQKREITIKYFKSEIESVNKRDGSHHHHH